MGMISSRIALGTRAIGGSGDLPRSIATIRAASDRGIAMIGTAAAQGFGRSGETVGQALAHAGRGDRPPIAKPACNRGQPGLTSRRFGAMLRA